MNLDLVKQHDILAPLLGSRLLDVVESDGAELKTTDGNTYTDLAEICVLLGQKNPRFTRNIKDAMNCDTGKSVKYKNQLFKYMLETTNHDFDKILLTSSGSETVEFAVRLARKRTGRCEAVSFWNSIHGRTYLASSLSGLANRKTGYGPLASGVLHAPYPYCYRCPFDKTPDNCNFRCLEFMKQKIEAESSQDIAAVIIEPMQGAGIIIPPEGYFQALRRWTSDNGVELILDEIQSSLGRVGHMYEYQQAGITPDMLLLGKGLGNGLHISALLIKGNVLQENLIIMAGGSGDAPLSCAGACAVYEELIIGDIWANIKQVGEYLHNALHALSNRHSCIGEVRGRGMAFGIEMVSDRITKVNNFNLAKFVTSKLRQHGYLTNIWQSTITIRPPFSLELKQAEAFVGCLDKILSE